MFEKSTLGNTGIEVLEKLEDEKVIDIVNQVSTLLVKAFPNSGLNYLDIYKTLLDTPMYYAKIPEGLSKVNYYFKNSSIYFAEDVNLSKIDKYIMHEFIHKLQERKDKKGNITRIGICEVNELSMKAAALNEGAIQYITSNIFEEPLKIINAYGIELPSTTEYYSIITNIVSQLALLLGEDILIDSTIKGKEDFKIEIIDNIGESAYKIIEKNLNSILQNKNDIYKSEDNMDEERKTFIKELYFDTQNIIFTSFFNNMLKRIEDESDIELIRKKLDLYRNLIGTTSGYCDFDEYYINYKSQLKNKSIELINKTPLMVIKDNIFFRIVRRIKILFSSKKDIQDIR